MKILGIIPARGKSKRLANKNILPLLGKPIIAYAIEEAKQSKLIDKLVVSTDSEKIAAVARKYAVEVIKRPKEFARDASPMEDCLRHVINYLQEKENYYADIVVLIYANIPVRKPGIIDKVIKKLLKTPQATSVVTAYETDQRPEWMKLMDKNGKLKQFLTINQHLFRKQDLEKFYLIDGAVAAIWTKTLMETKGNKNLHAFLGENVYAIIQGKKYSLEIDIKEDLELVKYYLKESL